MDEALTDLLVLELARSFLAAVRASVATMSRAHPSSAKKFGY